jgi:hypothetical protein
MGIIGRDKMEMDRDIRQEEREEGEYMAMLSQSPKN